MKKLLSILVLGLLLSGNAYSKDLESIFKQGISKKQFTSIQQGKFDYRTLFNEQENKKSEFQSSFGNKNFGDQALFDKIESNCKSLKEQVEHNAFNI